MLLNANCVFWVLQQQLSETYLRLRKIEPDMIKLYNDLHVQYPLFLSDFNEIWIFFTRVSKNTQLRDLMKIRLQGAKLFHADRRTGMTKLIDAFRNFANASKNRRSAHVFIHVLSLYLKTSLISLCSTNWFTQRFVYCAVRTEYFNPYPSDVVNIVSS
jgi:hypothetical protein